MKRYVLPAMALLALLAACLPATGPVEAAPTAKGSTANYQATVSRIVVSLQTKAPGGASWVAAHLQDHLVTGAYASTDAKSQATLLFRNGMRLDMNHNTDVIIKNSKDTHVSAGELYAQVPTGQGGTNVNTGTAVASVQGTKFDVQVIGNRTILTVVEHKVRFYNKYGAVMVQANQQSVVVADHAPTPPVTVDASKVVRWASGTAYSPQLVFPPHFPTPAQRKAAVAQATHDSKGPPSRAYPAFLQLGNAASDEGNAAEAIRYYQRALALNAHSQQALTSLGQAYLVSGQLAQASRYYDRAHQLYPYAASPVLGQGHVALLNNDVDTAATLYALAEQRAPTDSYIPFYLGQALIAQGLFTQAISQERLALSKAPSLAPAAVALGDVYTLMDNPSTAVAAYRRALTSDPHLWVAWNDLSVALNALGRLDDAISALKQAVATATSPYQRSLSLGALAFQLSAQGHPAMALPYAQQATQFDPTNAQAFYQLGDLYDYGIGDNTRAVTALTRALRLSPHLAAAWADLGDVYYKQTLYQKAIAAEQQAIKDAPMYIYPRTELGLIYQAMGDSTQAVAAYKGAVTAAPLSADAWAQYGVGLLNAGQMKQALAALQYAIQLVPAGNPSASTAYGYLSALYTDEGEMAKAISAGQQGVYLNPQDDIALSSLGFALIANGQQARAIPYLQDAVAINPRESSYWQFLAQAYRLNGQTAKALADAKQAVALAPRDTDAWYELGKELQGTGDAAGALAAFERSATLDPTNSIAWVELGPIYYNQGPTKYSQAIIAFKHALAQNPDDTRSWAYLGTIYYQQKQYKEALPALLKAAGDPQDAQSRELIVLIYLHNNDYTRALSWSTKLRTISPSYGEFFLGYSYQLMGGHQALALSHYKKALALAQTSKDSALIASTKVQLAQLAQK